MEIIKRSRLENVSNYQSNVPNQIFNGIKKDSVVCVDINY